ncbi:MAG: low molecular weight phosphatase family protein [Planctomycetaceae bacterium]
MASILVVCTGNVCRSPIAEGLLRHALRERAGDAAPAVSSAGTAGWDGSGAMPESQEAARELGVDLATHVARRLTPALVAEADLVVGMAGEHREAVGALGPQAAARAFTLKELVRLLEQAPADGELAARVAAADGLRRRGFEGNPWDEDVVDPLGLPLESYRAIAWELQEWTARLAECLVGPVPATVRGEEQA